jgi:triosephosphate isomerase
MSRRIPWIGTSWKMNKIGSEAREFAIALKASSVANSVEARLFIIPPFPYIAEVGSILRETQVKIGAQNMHWEDAGAWTGEISPLMLKDCGATMVELGHSERRTYFGETDDTVALKVKSALKHELLALVCIGETKAVYDAGRTAELLQRQISIALSHVAKAAPGRVVIAYEPVWSIGDAGIPADPDWANEQHRGIKAMTADITGEALPVVYGGSVNPQNCCDFATRSDIDGLFIGRSAWDSKGYIGIVEAVTASLKSHHRDIANENRFRC